MTPKFAVRAWILLACMTACAGCASDESAQPSNSRSELVALNPGASSGRSRLVSIDVPTGFHYVRKDLDIHFAFTGFETVQLTVHDKLYTGIYEDIDYQRNGVSAGTYSCGGGGNPLPPKVPNPNPMGCATNEIPVECRVTIFETDQPPAYHREPWEGKRYKVLWTRTFKGPFQ